MRKLKGPIPRKNRKIVRNAIDQVSRTMALHGLPAPQALQHARVPRGAWHRVDRRHIVRAVVAEPPAADEVVQLSSKVTKDLRGERRKFNFAAGPGCLPKSVLETAQEDLLNYNGAGVSVMEMSHRSKEFIDICDRAEKDLRELLGIPDEYEVPHSSARHPHLPAHPPTDLDSL